MNDLSPQQAIDISKGMMDEARAMFDKYNLKVGDLIEEAVRDYSAAHPEGQAPSKLVLNRWLHKQMTPEDIERWDWLLVTILERDDLVLVVG